MKISYNWLKQYIDVDLSPEKMAEILTDIGLEVEKIETRQSVKGGLEGLTIGEVKWVGKHPKADKLSLTKVDIGSGELLPIVCGAPNVAEGQKVVVATVGTTLYFGDDELKIKKAKLRGESSHGMICAEDEIGLGDSHEGIMVLDAKAPVGMPAKEYFDIETDTILEIAITPNRPDGASHLGVARDLAAYLNVLSKNKPVHYQTPDVNAFAVDNTDNTIEVEIDDPDLCPRYTAITISGIEVKESPDWLKKRLLSIDLKPINNVVDITNFVLHETGHPLHAFDTSKITGNKVIVKTLPEGTSFVTLDEEKRQLSADDLMICNTEEGMCIAGVFGGVDSGVTAKTTDVFLESAYFNPVSVRKTSKRHGLSTDSAFRFERGANPNMTVYALKRAALLIRELAGGKISSEVIDNYPKPINDFAVSLSIDNLKRLIGKELPRKTIKKILTSLEITIASETSQGFKLFVPPYRVDVQREADVIEEILRIYGYNNIEISNKLQSSLAYAPKPNMEQLRNKVANLLTDNGFNETMSLSLTKSAYYTDIETFSNESLVEIVNPLSNDLNSMRQTLLFNGLETVARNNNFKISDLKFYELGYCYFKGNNVPGQNDLKGYSEQEKLALFISGNKRPESWNLKEQPSDFYYLKGYVELVLKRLNIPLQKLDLHEIENSELFDYGLTYSLKKKPLVSFGLVHHRLQKQFDIENNVFFADFDWLAMVESMQEDVRFSEIPKYPEVRRDLALLLDKKVNYSEIEKIAYEVAKKYLKAINLFDVYEGKNLESGKKSYAVSFILQDMTKTLTDKEIEKTMNKLMKTYEKRLNAKIR